MPGTTRKPKAVAETPVDGPKTFEAPTSVEGLAAIVVELLEHVVLRDSDERAVLRARLTGEEVPDADEEVPEQGDSEG